MPFISGRGGVGDDMRAVPRSGEGWGGCGTSAVVRRRGVAGRGARVRGMRLALKQGRGDTDEQAPAQ
jgi:hypothetical protein